MTRRSFLSRASGGLAGLALIGPGRRAEAIPAGDALERLRGLFRDPPPGARPMTRWWWFGGAVTPEEITRELTFMKEAGLRGAEVQPVYPVAVDAPERGIRHLLYHSEPFLQALAHAVREARRLGLQLDFTLGSGWPYGGPFIPTGLASRRLRELSQEVTGPRELRWDLGPHVMGDERLVAVVAAPVGDEGEPDLDRSQVLADLPKGFRVPAGRWRITVVLDTPTGQQVKRPTLGMEGNVLDHLSREAMELFLRAAGDRVLEALRSAGDPPFDSVFCDSLEVYGADWTADFLQEFRARRGYDLAPRLPALWREAGPLTPHVRHDYHQTLSELNLERFFRPLVEWAGRRGMRARIQAHGAPGDVMQAYGLADVPEGETIFGGDRYAVNLRNRRFASSAGHLYGRAVVSAEAYTWLRTPMFMTTLEAMKAATDALFLDGINQIVNHGYAYSPPVAGEPGWTFYASTEVNHTNTWWRHYPHLARYVQRASALLQQGRAVNPVAVYLPLGDLFASLGAGGVHIDVEAAKRLGPDLLDGLRRAGYDFDVVHDHALAALASVEGGQLIAGTGRYSVVIVPPARFMPPESGARLAELARAGGHVIFIERRPDEAPGLMDREERSARLRRSWESLRDGKGTAAVVPDEAAAIARLSSLLAPDFEIVEPRAVESVGFTHRRAEGVDCYFVANVSDLTHELRVRFGVGYRAPERWDVETGAVLAPLVYEYTSARGRQTTEVELRMEPYESCFVVFGKSREEPLLTRTRWPGHLRLAKAGGRVEATGWAAADGTYVFTLRSGKEHRFSVAGVPPPLSIEGPWTLTLGKGAPVALRGLVPWSELAEGQGFSGWGTYETEFEAPAPGEGLEWVLDLGIVHETAEASLNDQGLGAAWKGRRRLGCGAALRYGRNRLRVEVANLWIHAVVRRPPPPEWKALEETFGIRWGRYGEVKPERLPPSGLLGPVRLLPRKRHNVRI